ncbi:MAG: TetR/AcrR family transcriptional regulator C-terminal domain-containing protein [Clostridiales Family XIII bacterium]|nr:TetR/AcrR family transcriptional regulator C-terminal domain-containing protein [Clostridiales Family XIII bacterium]
MNEQKSRTTKKRLAAALESLMREKPLAKIAIREIAARAGVDRQTFYYHFETLDQAVRYLCMEKFAAIAVDKASERNLREILRTLLTHIDADREFFALLIDTVGRGTLKTYLSDRTAKIANAIIGAALEGGRVRDKEKEFAASYCLAATATLVESWIRGEIRLSAPTFVSLLCRAPEWIASGMREHC